MLHTNTLVFFLKKTDEYSVTSCADLDDEGECWGGGGVLHACTLLLGNNTPVTVLPW